MIKSIEEYMIDGLKALVALHDLGTMGQAAARLRVTQSAISKRIAALEDESGQMLIERRGRRVQLTASGMTLLQNARPLLVAFKDLLRSQAPVDRATLAIGVSDSIMSSWGASLWRDVARRLPELGLDLHVHRSVLAVELVRSGDYTLALCADAGSIGDLQAAALCREPLVVIPAGLDKLKIRSGDALPVITIEPSAATWLGVHDQVRRHVGRPGKIKVTRSVESFSAVAQMAIAGFGHGLVPLGVARALKIKDDILLRFHPELGRRISLIARPTTFSRPIIGKLLESIRSSRVIASFVHGNPEIL